MKRNQPIVTSFLKVLCAPIPGCASSFPPRWKCISLESLYVNTTSTKNQNLAKLYLTWWLTGTQGADGEVMLVEIAAGHVVAA